MSEAVKFYVEGFSIEELSGMIQEIENRPKDQWHINTEAVLNHMKEAKDILSNIGGF